MSDDLSPVEQARAARWAADWLLADEDHRPMYSETCARALRRNADDLDPPESVESLRAERDRAYAQVQRYLEDLEAQTAERDRLDDALRKSLAESHYWQEQFRLTCDESAGRKAALVAMSVERDAAVDQRERAECVIRDHIAALHSMRTERGNAVYWRDQNATSADHRKERFEAMRAERDEAWRSALNLQAKLDGREDAAAEREPRVWHKGDSEPEGVAKVLDQDGTKWFNNEGVWIVEGDGRTWDRVLRNYAPLTEVLNED